MNALGSLNGMQQGLRQGLRQSLPQDLLRNCCMANIQIWEHMIEMLQKTFWSGNSASRINERLVSIFPKILCKPADLQKAYFLSSLFTYRQLFLCSLEPQLLVRCLVCWSIMLLSCLRCLVCPPFLIFHFFYPSCLNLSTLTTLIRSIAPLLPQNGSFAFHWSNK